MAKEKTRKDGGGLTAWQRVFIIALPVVCFAVCLCLGRMMLSPAEVFRALAARLGIAPPVLGTTETVVWSMRLPRLLLAALVGIGLSVSGCTFQSLFSNPLATPDTLGVASGAGFGAALALLFGMSLIGVQVSALLFGWIAVVLTGISGAGIERSRNTPILAGIIIGSLFSSLISLIKFTADTESQLPAITYWLMGSMESADIRSLMFGAPPILAGTVILFLLRWKMNVLPLSEDEAISAGVNLKALRLTAELCATMMTASCVSLCGQVGWVGLLVPHLCRMKFGSNHVSLIPASIGIGAAFMMVVDTAARTVSPKEIPISILTALIGAPFFIWLLRGKNGRRGWSL